MSETPRFPSGPWPGGKPELPARHDREVLKLAAPPERHPAERLLARALLAVERSDWRDAAGLHVRDHPVFDDVREYLLADR